MRYETAAAFRTALEARLKTAQSEHSGLSRLRKRVVFERLLARLNVVAPDGWVLKGGFALELRLGDHARTTKDIDIDWQVDESEGVELLLDVTALDLDDRFEFSLERSRAEDDAQRGQRWAVTATLAGREFERVAIDVEFATSPVLEPGTVTASHLLDFAGIDPVPVRTLAIEQHVAEKLHAYTRRYAGDAPSSRVKDLVDLVVIARTSEIDAASLIQAIEAIFARRTPQAIPRALPEPPTDWAPGWRKLAMEVPAEKELGAGCSAAAAFLDPILDGRVASGTWNPDGTAWIRA